MQSNYLIAIIVFVVIAIIIFGARKLMASEVKKNDPNLAEPRDSNTAAGNQGVLPTRKTDK